MDQHQPGHVNRAFVVRNHHRQKIGVGLAGEAVSYITGEIVVVDGGRMTLNYTVAV